MGARGIDVSHYQSTTPPLAGLDFLIAKATDGAVGPDARYPQHIAAARRAGLIVGAYHYNNAHAPIADQVDQFLRVAGDVDLYALDVEGRAEAFDLAQAREFIARVHGRGKKIGLYHSESGFFDAGQDWDWVAHYGVAVPSRPWQIHQYSSGGSIPGYAGRLDLDRFNGGAAQLRAFAHPEVTLWGPDVPPAVRAVDPSGKRVMAAVRHSGHNPGALVNVADLAAALRRAGHSFGSVLDPLDVQWLLRWAGGTV